MTLLLAQLALDAQAELSNEILGIFPRSPGSGHDPSAYAVGLGNSKHIIGALLYMYISLNKGLLLATRNSLVQINEAEFPFASRIR